MLKNIQRGVDMKKIFLLMTLMLLSISLIGCAMDKPENAVDRFFTAAKTFDSEKMNAALMVNDSSINEAASSLVDGSYYKFQIHFLDYLKSNASKVEYTVKETTVDGDKAVVTVDVRYIDASSMVRGTIGDVFRELLANAFSGVELTEEQTGKMFTDALASHISSDEQATVEKTLTINCVKSDNKWYVSELNADIMDVFLSNFMSVGEDMQNAF